MSDFEIKFEDNAPRYWKGSNIRMSDTARLLMMLAQKIDGVKWVLGSFGNDYFTKDVK